MNAAIFLLGRSDKYLWYLDLPNFFSVTMNIRHSTKIKHFEGQLTNSTMTNAQIE